LNTYFYIFLTCSLWAQKLVVYTVPPSFPAA